MSIKIDLKIFVFIILYYFTKQIELYSIIMIFAMLHELGHLLCGILVGMKPSSIKVMPFGFSISFRPDIEEYNYKILNGNIITLKKIVIALAGPLVNLIFIILFYNLNLNIIDKQMIIFSNLVILIFNILPIYPLDGGRILKGILHIIFGIKNAKIYTNDISIVVTIFLTFASSIAIYYFKNIAILFIILFMWFLILKENRKFKMNMQLYDSIEKYNVLH